MKLINGFALLLIFMVAGAVLAQAQDELQKRLENLEAKWQDIQGQIEQIKSSPNPSPENKEALAELESAANELQQHIREIKDRLQNAPDDDGDEHGNDATFNHAAKFKEKMQILQQELKKIQEKMATASDDEREALEARRDKIREEARNLASQMRKMQEPKENMKRPAREDGEELRHDAPELDRPEVREKLEELKKNMPDKFNRLMEMRRRNPEQFRQTLDKFRPDKPGQKDPVLNELFQKQRKLEERLRKLGPAVQRTSGDERDKQVEELRNLLNEIFDLRQQAKEYQIKKELERINQMQQGAQKRKENKQMIVDRELKKMLGENDEWEW